MKKVFLLVLQMAFFYTATAQQNLVDTKRLIVRDSIYFGGAWHSVWPSGSTTPTWQQTLTTGSVLSSAVNITGAVGLSFTDQSSFNVVKSGIGRLGINNATTQIYAPGGQTGLILSNSIASIGATNNVTIDGGNSAGRNSSAHFYADSLVLKPSLGVLIFDSLNNETTQNSLIGWTSTSGANRGKAGYITLGPGFSILSGTLNTSPPLSSISPALGSNSIDHGNYLQTWNWNSHTGLFPAFIFNRSSTALGPSGGPIVSIVSSGANASANGVAGGLVVSVTNTGSSSTNGAVQITASGATNNTALQINSGDVLLTPLTASLPLKLNASKKIISQAIALGSSEISGVLPLANGGTGSTDGLGLPYIPKSGAATINNADWDLNSTTFFVSNGQVRYSLDGNEFKVNTTGDTYLGDVDNGTYIRVSGSSGDNITEIHGNNIRFNSFDAGTLITDGSGNVSSTSDKKVKHNIKPFTYGLNSILKLNTSTFIYNTDKSNTVMSGFIAQDVQKAIPIAVHSNKSGMLSLETNAILAANVNATKELYSIIVKLKNEIEDLKKELKNK